MDSTSENVTLTVPAHTVRELFDAVAELYRNYGMRADSAELVRSGRAFEYRQRERELGRVLDILRGVL